MTPANGPAELTLLVAGESVTARSARANLAALIGAGVAEAERVRVVDILEQPAYALRYRVFFTPSLIVETPAGTTTIVGDLEELDRVKRLLASV